LVTKFDFCTEKYTEEIKQPLIYVFGGYSIFDSGVEKFIKNGNTTNSFGLGTS
jgi:hypothetical protein